MLRLRLKQIQCTQRTAIIDLDYGLLIRRNCCIDFRITMENPG